MSPQHPIYAVLALIVLAFGQTRASASEYLNLGEHTIYATALSSMLIPPEVAQIHGIVRSTQRIVVNVTVLKADQPTTASVSGTSTNLLGQQLDLDFTEIQERTAIYYLASIITNAKDMSRFHLYILPEGAREAGAIRFERSYYPTH